MLFQAEVKTGEYPRGVRLMTFSSLEAIASKWKDLPRFGANATSCTGSVTATIVSTFVHFLQKQ